MVLAEVALGSQPLERVRVELGQAAHLLAVAVEGLERPPDGEEAFAAKGLERVEDLHVAHVASEVANGQEALDPAFDLGMFVGEGEGGFEPGEAALVRFLGVAFHQVALLIDPLHDVLGRRAPLS